MPGEADPFAQGVRLFNEEYFFEAHEHLEGLWNQERGDPRLFLQGLIQVCAGFHHFQNGNPSGAVALLKRGVDKMRRYPPRYLGIDAGSLIERVDAARGEIEGMIRGGASAPLVYPKIEPPSDG